MLIDSKDINPLMAAVASVLEDKLTNCCFSILIAEYNSNNAKLITNEQTKTMVSALRDAADRLEKEL